MVADDMMPKINRAIKYHPKNCTVRLNLLHMHCTDNEQYIGSLLPDLLIIPVTMYRTSVDRTITEYTTKLVES